MTGEISSWTSDEITIMMDAIGTTLPEGPFSSERQSEGYVDENDGAYTFYMFDPSSGNVCEQYASILEDEGYTSDGTDNSYGYTLYFYYLPVDGSNTDLIYVQFGYYPGDDEYAPSIDLYAWIYSEGEGEAWMYESWPSAEIASFLSGLTSLPEVPGTGFDLYDYDGALFLYAETESNIESTYTNILVNAGWTVDDSEYDTYGIIAISSSNDVEICFYYDFDYGYFILMAYAI